MGSVWPVGSFRYSNMRTAPTVSCSNLAVQLGHLFSRTKTYEASVFDVTLNLLLSFDQLFEVCARSTLVVSSFLYATLNLTIYSCFLTHKIHAGNSNLALSTSFSQPRSRSLSSQFLSGEERAWERGCHLYKFQTNVDCRSYNTRQK